MAEHRVATKGRRMGSSRRKQLREGSGEAPAPAPSPGEEPPWASEIAQRVQDFFKERDKDQAGFVTRSDMQKLQEEDFPCSMEELELVFDGLDTAGTGRLSTEEFTAGLRQFLRSQKAARDHRRRKTASRRVRLVLPSPTLEGADSEERRHFAAFMDQLGTANVSEEQEIWQLWVKLRQDEPQLLGNLEDFLAKMRHRIQEARSKKKALEVTLNKHVAEHDKEVQQLCEALEQQIHQEQQQLQQESMARSHQHSVELQQALDASEREVQRLVMAQMELETRCRSLRSTQQAASTENQQLEESNRVLEDHLQHLRQQLQQTQGRLQAARASVVWERTEEPGDGAAAELPGEIPLSPQTSLEKSEKHRSEMRIRLGSQSGEPKAKATYQVVWEMPPADTSLLGAPRRVSSAEEDPFPEFLKEERFSDQSSLLREMNDAIAALSKQLKPQAPGVSPTPADTARHPRDDAEPQTGPEAATAHGTTPGVGRKTLPSHISHQPVEGDLQEGPATAELRAPDVTQAGASVGAGHRRAQELGAEQGESPEEAWRMSFLQGKGAGVKELMLKAAEHPQGAPGESMEAGEQALMEVEVEGWMQKKTGWEKAQPPGEAEEAALSQGENLEAGLGTPEAGDAGLAAGWRLAMDELGPAAAPGELAQPLNVGLGEEADPPLGLSEKPEVKPGECLEPEPPSPGEARMGAAQGDGVTPEVTVAPGPGRLAEERVGAEVQPWGQTLDAQELPAQAQHGGSSRAGAEEGDVEGLQPQGESTRGAAAVRGGSLGAGVMAAAPPAEVQDGGAGPDVAPLEAQSSDANMQLLPEVEVALQPPGEAGFPGTEQGGSLAPGVEPLDQVDKPEFVEMEAEDSQADMKLCGGPSLETPQGCHAALQHVEEAEDGAQGQGEHELPHEPVFQPHRVTIRQGEGAGAGLQPQEEAEILDTLEDQSTDANVQLIAEADELKLTPGGGTETDLQPQNKAGALWTEQGGSLAPGVEPLDQVDKPELVEMEAGDSQADMELCGSPSLETPQGCHAALQHVEEAEDGAQGLEEHELPCKPALDPQGAGVGQTEGAGAGVEPPEEAEILDTLEDQSIDANVQLIAEADELKLTQEGSTEIDLQLSSEASSLDTEQGGSLAPDVEPLDQADKPESVELEIEDTQADTKLHGGLSPEAPRGGPGGAAVQLGEEAEDGAQGLEEHELPHEPVLDPQGAGVGQGEGAGAGVEPPEEAEILDTLEAQSTDANAQPVAEADKLKLTLGWSTEADLAPWDAAGMREEEQSQMPGSMAGLCAAHTADAWEGAAGAHASPPAEATLYPERAAAAEGPALGAKLGALAGPGGQILADTQPLELPQGDRAAAEGGPLDGAQGLEVVQGERLEAGASLGETQDLGLKQGHDDGASALASPVSKVPVQISTLKLETMMQEDVLVPDGRRLSASGQGAQSELQEQVSAQADKVRLHTASQQPEEKPPHVMETEQAAAGPAEPPKPEVPPASTLHTRVRQEDAGNDQLGMVLGDSSLGDAANSSLQPQRQLVGEKGDDLTTGQREKQQEVGRKMSQKSQPSPGEPGAVIADGAGAAPRGSPEASPDPDHLYNVLFIGDSHVGKTSFLYRLHADTFNPHLTATVGLDYHVKNFIVDNKCFALRLWDSAGQERYRSITKQFFRKADGVVVMYDITSEYSFSDTRYWLSCIQEGAEDGVVILLLGNKTDCAAERQVPTKEGERLAKEHQLMFYECSAASGHNVSESMVSLIRSLKVREDELKNEAKEVAKPPQKKKGCCW
ncbi:ras-related protein Rab-44 [Rissa tridactyla]|nr:ras-related protein Rab-44 [Rissa tridactyla]